MLLGNILNKPYLICLYTQLHGFKYSYLAVIFLFNNNHLFVQLNGFN